MVAATDVAFHPVVVMEALIGLADTERHDDDMGAAEEFYRKAAEAADEVGFEFGALRGRLPLCGTWSDGRGNAGHGIGL